MWFIIAAVIVIFLVIWGQSRKRATVIDSRGTVQQRLDEARRETEGHRRK